MNKYIAQLEITKAKLVKEYFKVKNEMTETEINYFDEELTRMKNLIDEIEDTLNILRSEE